MSPHKKPRGGLCATLIVKDRVKLSLRGKTECKRARVRLGLGLSLDESVQMKEKTSWKNSSEAKRCSNELPSGMSLSPRNIGVAVS